MKIHHLFVVLPLSLLSLNAFSGWQVIAPNAATPREPFFQTRTQPKHVMPGANTFRGVTLPHRTTAIHRDVDLPSHRVVSRHIEKHRIPPPHQFVNPVVAAAPARRPVYAVSISGSLKENIERIMGRYHWKVIWKAPYDYNFDGRITGSSLPNVIDKLFHPFPLQAVMYMANRTITVIPKKRT